MPARPSPLLAILAVFAVLETMSAQQSPPPTVEHAPAAAAAAQRQRSWWQFLDRATLSCGRYRLAAGAADGQQPHDRDEVYFVVAGAGRITVADQTLPAAAGDTLFVAAGAAHHFHDITEDLDLLVFFSAARPATGGMAAGPQPTGQTPYAETSPRGNTRIFYWYGPDSAGQVSIDHGRPRWQAAYGKFLTTAAGRRWRFGENFWTTLDTNMVLELAGVEVPIGQHYCVLESGDDGLQLILLDPTEVRRQRLDAYETPKTKGGIRVPLERREAPVTAERLAIELVVDRAAPDRGELLVDFGPHRLRAALAMHPHR